VGRIIIAFVYIGKLNIYDRNKDQVCIGGFLMGYKMLKWYLVLLLIVITCVPLISAVTIDISPDHVSPGDSITVTTHGLKDGSIVTMKMQAIINNPDPNFNFQVQNLVFPINLDESSFSITNENTVSNTVNINNYIPSVGYTYVTIGGQSVNNSWTGGISGEGRDDINGTFSLIKLWGVKRYGASNIISTMQWEGIKQASEDNIPPGQVNGGPEDFVLSFSQNGIKSGSIEITILVNGTVVTSEVVSIGNAASVPFTNPMVTKNVQASPSYSFSSSIPTNTPTNLFALVQNPGPQSNLSVVANQVVKSGTIYSRFSVNKPESNAVIFTQMNNSEAGIKSTLSRFMNNKATAYTGKYTQLY
jgi:hypothetical protein